MSNLSEMLTVSEAQKLAKVQGQAPKSWRAGEEWVGDLGTITTRGTVATGPQSDALLRDAGYDPTAFCIVGDIRHSTWDAQTPTGLQRLTSYRFNIRPIGQGANIDELIKLVGKRRPAKKIEHDGGKTFHFYIGDTQLGKADGDGTEGIVDRVLQSIDMAKAQLKAGAKKDFAYAHIGWMGDCMEGFVSQGGKNAWRTELTITEQLRLTRRLMLHSIDELRPYVDRLTVVSIPGNHDEAMRPVTRYDDSFAVDSLIAVADSMKMNPLAYGNVETFVPQEDQLTVTLDVNGTIVTHAHGHQWRAGKHWSWFEGQAFDRAGDVGQADVLASAHGHHFQVDTRGDRTFFMTPAEESLSQWWLNKTGQRGAPGALTCWTEAGKIGGFEIV